VDEALVLCRLLHFAATSAFGVGIFQAALAPAALADALRQPLRPWWRRRSWSSP
jgi:hypothetical protein